MIYGHCDTETVSDDFSGRVILRYIQLNKVRDLFKFFTIERQVIFSEVLLFRSTSYPKIQPDSKDFGQNWIVDTLLAF